MPCAGPATPCWGHQPSETQLSTHGPTMSDHPRLLALGSGEGRCESGGAELPGRAGMVSGGVHGLAAPQGPWEPSPHPGRAGSPECRCAGSFLGLLGCSPVAGSLLFPARAVSWISSPVSPPLQRPRLSQLRVPSRQHSLSSSRPPPGPRSPTRPAALPPSEHRLPLPKTGLHCGRGRASSSLPGTARLFLDV